MRRRAGLSAHRRCTILVVDDDLDIREALSDALQTTGHQVVTAATGVEALQRLSEIRGPCMVFVDVSMPQMNGYELCRRVRSTGAFQNIPICVVTAEEIDNVPGADHVLFKPVDLDVLLGQVHRYTALVTPELTPTPTPSPTPAAASA